MERIEIHPFRPQLEHIPSEDLGSTVYDPSEDSFLLADAIISDLSSSSPKHSSHDFMTILEVGYPFFCITHFVFALSILKNVNPWWFP
jgi:hypothetical protein